MSWQNLLSGIQDFAITRIAKIIYAILDTILPLKSNSSRINKKTAEDFCIEPTEYTLLNMPITCLLQYIKPEIKSLIKALKYEHDTHSAKICAKLLSDYLEEEIANIRKFSPRPVLLVPVPMHNKRLLERGFNHVERVIRKMPGRFLNGDISKIETQCLSKIKHTPQQAKLTRNARLKNIKGSFIADKNKISKTHIIIIDDVATTGATLRECANTLRKTGAKVTALAIARA